MGETSFTGRTALVTGAASGIGAATCRWLAHRGLAELVAVDLDAPALAALDLPCRVHAHPGNVADPALWERIENAVPRLDHALVNAGIANGTPLAQTSFEEWRRILAVNLDGAFLALRAAMRLMQRDAAPAPRSIVVTSSAAGVKPVAGTCAYGSSKAAVIHLARVAAAEGLADGIRVNAVAPGRVDTPIWTKTDHFAQLASELGSREAALAALAGGTGPESGFTTADQMAAQIGFLLSDLAVNITGTVLVSDGGYTL